MTPHERAAEFVASYLLTEGDLDITNFQRVLEMKVSTMMMLIYSLNITHKLFTGTKEG